MHPPLQPISELRPRALGFTGPFNAVRCLGLNERGHALVEVTSSSANNPLYRSFLALQALGVDIVHAEVRPGSGGVFQRLHLLERDGTTVGSRRLSHVVAALRFAHPVPFHAAEAPLQGAA